MLKIINLSKSYKNKKVIDISLWKLKREKYLDL